VLHISLLLGAAESLTAGGLVLLFIGLFVGFLLETGSLGLVLSDALSLGLLVGGSGSSSLGLGLFCLLCLLALYLGILGGIPVIDNLKKGLLVRNRCRWTEKLELTSLSSSSSPNLRRAVTGGVESLPLLLSPSSSSG
jgi:hypothetical protein